MPEQEASTAELRLPLSTRVRVGLRHGANWLQLVRFGLVGASGYVLNLAVYALCVHPLGIDYRVSATIAFLAAVSNNFWWNRHWTFKATAGNAKLPGRALPRRLPGRLRAGAAPAPTPGRRRGPAQGARPGRRGARGHARQLPGQPPLDLQVIVRALLRGLVPRRAPRAGGLGPDPGLAADLGAHLDRPQRAQRAGDAEPAADQPRPHRRQGDRHRQPAAQGHRHQAPPQGHVPARVPEGHGPLADLLLRPAPTGTRRSRR